MEAKRKGIEAELFAKEYLESMGWKTLATNWRSGRGEIDLVMQEKELLVFVEVKHRPSQWAQHHCFPAMHQVRTLLETAARYQERHPWFTQARFDFILLMGKLPSPQCHHYPGGIA